MGQLTESGFVNYRHVRIPGREHIDGAITLRIEVDNDNETIEVSWAICSPKDQFSKEVGRRIADETFKNGRTFRGQYIRIFSLFENACLHLQNRLACRIPDDMREEYSLLIHRMGDIMEP